MRLRDLRLQIGVLKNSLQLRASHVQVGAHSDDAPKRSQGSDRAIREKDFVHPQFWGALSALRC